MGSGGVEPGSAAEVRSVELRRPGQLDALTGLRFFAAFFILLGHATSWTSPFTDSDALPRFVGAPSVYGMTLFFVLSGFVIHYNYGKLFRTMRLRWAVTEFFGARTARLYPLFLVFFCVGLVVDETLNWFLAGHGDFWFEMVIRDLTLTQSWFYSTIFGDRMVMSNAFGLAWSISTELFFYVAYIGLVFLVGRLRTTGQVLVCALIVTVATLAVMTTAIHFQAEIGDLATRYLPGTIISVDQKWSKSFIRWLFYYSPYARLPEFVMGCLVAQLYLVAQVSPASDFERRVVHVALWSALVLLLTMGTLYVMELAGVFGDYYRFLLLNFLTAVPIAILVYCIARVPSIISRLLAAAPLVALGEISYSIYAVHTWTLRIFIRAAPVSYSTPYAWDAAGRVVFGILLTLVLASATYRFIEIPGRRWLRRATERLLPLLYGSPDANKLPASTAADRPRAAAAFLVLLFACCLVYQVMIGL